MSDSKKVKMVIIGIDGGTFKIIDPLIKKGLLPNINKIIKSGVKSTLKSTWPPLTAPAWVSFMTGKNPGKHGFFDFRQYDPSEYAPTYIPTERGAVSEDISTLHSSRFHGETIWDYLGEAGYEMVVVAVPMTYPPWQINGRMVPGYPNPDYDNPKTYPPEWGREIGPLFNMSAIDYSKLDEFIKECKELVSRKARILLEQMRKKNGDIFSVVFSSSDFAQHYFWRFWEQQKAPYAEVIQEIYQEIDNVVGEILHLIDNDTSVIIMSDHGFMSHPGKYFHLNAWLLQERYISIKQNNSFIKKNFFSKVIDAILNQIKHRKENWKFILREKVSKMPLFVRTWISQKYYKSDLIEWNNTKAFRFKMYGTIEGIVINQKGRQKIGLVAKGNEYERLRDAIINEVLQIRDADTGEQVVIKALRREDIYKGDFLRDAPDIVIQLNSNYIGGLELEGPVISPVPVETRETLSGVHDEDGIFVFRGPNTNKGEEIDPVSIIDIAPTILYDLNLPISKDIDGRVVKEAFSASYQKNEPKYITVKKETENVSDTLSKEDEEQMKKALKGLGYLE